MKTQKANPVKSASEHKASGIIAAGPEIKMEILAERRAA
jgi:hypothetical protein